MVTERRPQGQGGWRGEEGANEKKYRVVGVVVQVQAAVAQRRGGPTTLVAGDA